MSTTRVIYINVSGRVVIPAEKTSRIIFLLGNCHDVTIVMNKKG
jgi:hypothetical protein